VRVALERASPEELQECLKYALAKAGTPKSRDTLGLRSGKHARAHERGK